MGRNKALLELRGTTLVEQVARTVREATGSVVLIGPPETYRHLGYPVYPDAVDGCGPMGGIYTALLTSQTDWNLIVACDFPKLQVKVLARILATAKIQNEPIQCVVPITEDGTMQPLSAAYHRQCIPFIERAIANKQCKLMDLLAELHVLPIADLDEASFMNVNSPADWERLADCPTRP